MKRLTLKSKIAKKIARSKQQIFLRSDFEKLGGYDQVGRALRQLISDGALVKVGYGLYAKARMNSMTGRPIPAAPRGFRQVAEDSLDRLGVRWMPSKAMQAYLAGSTQIPMNAEVILLDRCNRKIEFENFKLRMSRP